MNIEVTNILVVAITALIPLIVGTLWYSRLIFGKKWRQYEGVTPEMEEHMKKRSIVKKIVVAYITYFLIAYALAILVNYMVIAAIMPAIILAVVVWLGFMVPAAISDYLWSPHRKDWGLYHLHIGYFLVSTIIMSVVLALWV